MTSYSLEEVCFETTMKLPQVLRKHEETSTSIPDPGVTPDDMAGVFTWHRRTAQPFLYGGANDIEQLFRTSPHHKWCRRKRMQKRRHIRRWLLHQLEHKAVRGHVSRTPSNITLGHERKKAPYLVLLSPSRTTRSRHTCTARKTSRWTVGAEGHLFHRRANVSHRLNPVPPSASYRSGEHIRSAVSIERDSTSRMKRVWCRGRTGTACRKGTIRDAAVEEGISRVVVYVEK
ncbi:hypothetical protein EDB92DRAFT_428651 [Lactarius akahatsu]|uniref:Uncharacterized protein n=1 Tax=Lactarius akahatsu TaxID=416441 RepID=A0AAD4L5L2_9AGAM|nr:hypothetical protein EDB92DRAFT_428651 [Lactarius akahatsu]